MEEENLTSHEKKEMKKQQKEEEIEKREKLISKEKLSKNTKKYAIITVVILLILVGGYYFIIKPIKDFKPFHDKPYHWHANLKVSICGVPAQIRCPGSMCGPMNLHHHNDDIIHMEGSFVANKNDLALGKFFEGLGIKFSENEILGKKNGDLCPDGKAGKVSMYVNNLVNTEFGSYIPSFCESENIKEDCDQIDIRFE